MGIRCMEGIRAETRGRMRGATLAATHESAIVVRMKIRVVPEQCHDMKEHHPSENDTQVRGQCWETLLGVPCEMLRAHPSLTEKQIVTRSYDINRGDADHMRDVIGEPSMETVKGSPAGRSFENHHRESDILLDTLRKGHHLFINLVGRSCVCV